VTAQRGLLGLVFVLGLAQSCSNDFDQFELTAASAGSSSGGQLSLGGATAKAGTTSSRAGTTTNLAGTTTAAGGMGEGGMAEPAAAGTPGAAGAADTSGGAGLGGIAGAGPEPEPCGGPCTLDHATAQCVEDACAIDSCDQDFGDCNTSAADGCELPLQADLENCGECGRACAATHVAALECTSGTCSSSCAAGFANCARGELPDDGCETPVLTDVENCGGCDNACPDSFACKAGLCACDFKNDCGNGNGVACVNDVCVCNEMACRPGERCRDAQGSKVCSCNGSAEAGCSANELCCASGCTDVTSNPESCGACGRLCSTGFICASGTCQCDSAEDCGADTTLGGEAGAPSVGGAAAGGASDSGGAGAAAALPIACVVGVCVCNGNTCAGGQRCLADGTCG
jgi:hypothetical protein